MLLVLVHLILNDTNFNTGLLTWLLKSVTLAHHWAQLSSLHFRSGDKGWLSMIVHKGYNVSNTAESGVVSLFYISETNKQICQELQWYIYRYSLIVFLMDYYKVG